jgi:hypothetical protein
MADIERQRRMLGQTQPPHGSRAVASPSPSPSWQSLEGHDGYGDLEPYTIRTPDPPPASGTGSGLSFASVDWRPQSDFYGMVGMEDQAQWQSRI